HLLEGRVCLLYREKPGDILVDVAAVVIHREVAMQIPERNIADRIEVLLFPGHSYPAFCSRFGFFLISSIGMGCRYMRSGKERGDISSTEYENVSSSFFSMVTLWT